MKLLAIAFVFLINLGSFFFSSAAIATTAIELKDISYKECQGEVALGNVTSGSSETANCFLVTGKAVNNSGKTVYDADVFGRVYDANNEPAMQNRTRLGTLEEIPPGTSDFEVRISVSANQPTPLKLKQFKASGFAGKVRPYYYD